jgi:ribonuclease E
MTRKMLINAQRTEEVRVAIVTDGVLDKYEVSAAESGLCRGNIYRGIVANLQPSLDAAFVDIGLERDGLLRAEDVVRAAAHHKQEGRRPRIDRLLEKGRPVIVQVVRDGVGTKGPLVTTNLSIAGRCLVLMPHDDVRGVSRKVEDEKARSAIREKLEQLSLPDDHGVIVRTNAMDQPKAAFNRDLNALLRLWKRVRDQAASGKGPKLLYSDQDLILQVLRDSLDSSIQEVLVDDDEAFEKVESYMRTFMPRAKTKLVRYADRMPLFSRFQLEAQIDSIYQQRVALPSGGSLVIQRTEALTSIDVNSGRATRGGSQEETAHATNLEAATEVARQLRLRDIGGLVVVDLIDMRSPKHRREVERVLRDAMKDDKARFTVGRISPNGLLEVNRQRLKKELTLRTHRTCPTCSGTGSIASPELVGVNLLRRIETRAVTGRLKSVRVELHPELADAIQNDRRDDIAALENEFGIRVQVIAAAGLHRSEEHIEWFQRDDTEAAPRPEAAVTVADLAEGVTTPGTANGETPDKNRKRRRGSRRRRKPTPSAAAEGKAPDSVGESAEKSTPDGATPEKAPPGSDDDRPKKRRPRRRRRKKTTSASGGEPQESS